MATLHRNKSNNVVNKTRVKRGTRLVLGSDAYKQVPLKARMSHVGGTTITESRRPPNPRPIYHRISRKPSFTRGVIITPFYEMAPPAIKPKRERNNELGHRERIKMLEYIKQQQKLGRKVLG